MFRRDKMSEELEEELQFHLDARKRDNLNAGMNEEAARHDATKRFGSAALARERAHEANIVMAIDVRQRLTRRPLPAIYQPYQQVTRPFFLSHMSFVARTATNPQSVAVEMRAVLRDVDKNQPVSIAALTDLADASTAETWFQTRLISTFSILALLLAAIGIYGVLAYAVTERTREIGIRMALGAKKSDITFMLLKRTLLLVIAGVALGGCGALALTRVLSKLLFEVKPTDPVTFLAVAAILAVTGIVAGLLPARRATRVDPVVALRWE
jgi:putative ABC transport system permease protein